MLVEDRQQVLTTLGDVVVEQLDAVDAHKPEQRVVAPLEIAAAVLRLDRGELASKHFDEEVPGAACGLKDAAVDTLALALHQVEHGLDHPPWGKDLAVVGNPFF